MSGLYPAIDYLKNGTNKATNTKNAIIFMAEADETINKKIKEIEEKAMNEVISQKVETIHFDPNEIEPLVLKNRKDKNVSKDKFREELKIEQEIKLVNEEKKTQIKPEEQKER